MTNFNNEQIWRNDPKLMGERLSPWEASCLLFFSFLFSQFSMFSDGLEAHPQGPRTPFPGTEEGLPFDNNKAYCKQTLLAVPS